jgi:2-polyprenyl-6-methoxyphenol hydroxylase-like FAD-dependent oxidoreductase
VSEAPPPARPRSIAILGGGTAGWMAAMLFQRRWGASGTRVTLVESRDIGIIGVGEGSTPQLKTFFDDLGISEAEWMPRCNATYKTGIEFVGWSDVPGHERYFHPFQTALDSFTAPTFFHHTQVRRAGLDVAANPDAFFVPTRLAAERRAPVAPANFPFLTSYGYHFDAYLVGDTLRALATARGVERIEATIASVEVDADGNVAALVDGDGLRVKADLFVDASGFRAAIIEGALGEPHRSFASNLFNDRAVVMPTPVPAEGPEVATRSTALSAGWAWHIPLTNRSGNGYVHSSRFIDPETAERELRAHIGAGDEVEARHLSMRIGRVERCWVGNVLAIGLAQGFVEPLEATALHLVLATVGGYIDAVDRDGADEPARAAFNASIARRIEGIRDYLVCHYRAARRADSDYWRAATSHDELSESVKGLFTAWFTGADLEAEDLDQGIGDIYAPLSWHCLFGGYGNYPGVRQAAPEAAATMAEVERFVAGCASNFPSHRDALAALTT